MTRSAPLGTDWVDCVAAGARCRRAVARWQAGDQVEIEGVLRRRFFRAGADRSRLEIEVLQARRASS